MIRTLGNRVNCWNWAALTVGTLGAIVMHPHRIAAQEPAPTVPPRTNPSICYQVDPTWPQRPADMPWGAVPSITVDAYDQVWVFTRANPSVQVFTAAGKFVRAWDAEVGASHFLRFDPQGNIWLADCKQHVLKQFTPDGRLIKTLGTPGEPGEDATHFDRPTDVAITPSGELFITDGYGNNRVVHYDRQGKFVKAWGKRGTGPGEFNLPHSIVIDSQGRLYVADRSNARVQVFDTSGKFLDQWRNLLVPWGLCITRNDEIWACGSTPMAWRPEDKHLSCPPKDQVAIKFDRSGKALQVWTFPRGEDGKEKPGELNWLHGIAVDSQGSLYVGDIIGKRAQKFVLQK